MNDFLVNDEFYNKRLDIFVSQKCAISRSLAQKLIDEGKVFINSHPCKSSQKLEKGQKITIDDSINSIAKIEAENISLDIKYEDDFLLVINKPKGMLTHPTSKNLRGTLVNALLYHCVNNLSNIEEPQRRGIVHRLDKNTAGLMIAAKTNDAHNNLAQQIKDKTAKRKYLAIVHGVPEPAQGVIEKPLMHYLANDVKMRVAQDNPNAKYALTHYQVLESFEGASLVELELKTGRTHQIRIHMASINHPVFGDSLYGSKGFKNFNLKTDEQVLQSYKLNFTHPVSGEIMDFELKPKDWDKDLIKVLSFFRNKKE